MNKIIKPVLDDLRWQNRRFDEIITMLKNKKLDPLIAERILDNLPEPESSEAVVGLEKHKTLEDDIEFELSLRRERLKSLNGAIAYAKTVFKRAKVERDKQRRKEARYRARKEELPILESGELPLALQEKEAKRMLDKAVKAGLLDTNYQPVKGTTRAQLFVLTRYIGVCCKIRGYHAVFFQLWRIKNLEHTKWKPNDGQANTKKLRKVADLFPEYGYGPVPELT